MSYEVETVLDRNDEGSNFATVTLTFEDGTVEVEHFAQWVDSGEGVVSAAEQAASFLAALYESETYSLEERLAMEYEREVMER